MPPPDGASSNVTSNELDGVGVSPGPCVQRNEKRWGGWTSITVIGTTSTLPDASSRHVSSLVEPATGSISVSALHQSRMCSGLLMTSNTTSGEASMWTSRSMVPYSMVVLLCAMIGCVSP